MLPLLYIYSLIGSCIWLVHWLTCAIEMILLPISELVIYLFQSSIRSMQMLLGCSLVDEVNLQLLRQIFYSLITALNQFHLAKLVIVQNLSQNLEVVSGLEKKLRFFLEKKTARLQEALKQSEFKMPSKSLGTPEFVL